MFSAHVSSCVLFSYLFAMCLQQYVGRQTGTHTTTVQIYLTLANSLTVRTHYNDNRPHLYACFRVCTYEPPPRVCHGGCPSRVPSQQLHSVSDGSLFMWGWQCRLPRSDTYQLSCPGVQWILTWTMLQHAPSSTPPATAWKGPNEGRWVSSIL